MTRPFALAIVVSLAPGLVMACEIATYEPSYVVPAATFGADCSFMIPGETTYYTDVTGAVPVDIGGGRIGQRITRGFGCGWDEEVWIVDCNSGEMVAVEGQPIQDMNDSLRVDLLYPSQGGALRLTAETTVTQILALAAREGYNLHFNLSGYVGDRSGPNGADPTCGCARFYPDSTGARD